MKPSRKSPRKARQAEPEEREPTMKEILERVREIITPDDAEDQPQLPPKPTLH